MMTPIRPQFGNLPVARPAQAPVQFGNAIQNWAGDPFKVEHSMDEQQLNQLTETAKSIVDRICEAVEKRSRGI